MLDVLEGLATLAGWIMDGLNFIGGLLDLVDTASSTKPKPPIEEKPPS